MPLTGERHAQVTLRRAASRRWMSSRGMTGFTLVEVLVVLTLIVFLIALLLPALSRSRKNALLVQCANNLKNLGSGIHSYAVDHLDQIPFGPPASPVSVADFYVVDGLVTSQFSLLDKGKPVGIGLLLGHYLDRRPEIVFCPDTDQPFDAERELDRFGRTQAVSGYFYRHGSNTMETLSQPRETWDDHIRLSNLGLNRNGVRISALLMDQNFVPTPPVPAFNVVTRTNHNRARTNVLHADGRVVQLDNSDDRYTADIGNNLPSGPSRILSALEQADQPQ